MLFTRLKWKRILVVVGLAVAVAGPSYSADVGAESGLFPVYPGIQPNVSFWTQIYTQYTSDYGVLHDNRRLDIIYGSIELEDPDRAGGRKINQRRIKNAKKKFKAILAKLMRGEPPSGPEEQKVADLFGSDAKAADFRSAMYNIRCQVGQKDRFQAGLVRSGAYIEAIKQIFRDAGLPEDLAYLPHVESSFNPKAYSKFGAAGMWQFTRSTGRRFMEIGYTIDERRDPILSSRAAAKLLHANYQKLQSWPLAITAYNHGTSGMLRAVRRKGSYERIFKEYRSRIFKFASRNFYSEFIAAREAAKNYRQYFGDLKLDPPSRSREIVLAGYVALPQLAQHLTIDLAELRELNPALRSPVFSGQKYVPGGYRLRLPDGDDRDWEQLIAQLPPDIYRQNQKRSQIYTVRRGDTAGKIAKIHGVELGDLIAVNNLDRRATIYVNQTLRIPLPDEKPIVVARLEKRSQEAPEALLQTSNPQPTSPAKQSEDHTDQILEHPADDQITGMLAMSDTQASEENIPAAATERGPIKNPPQANQTAAFLFTQGAVSKFPVQNNLPPAQIQEPEEEQAQGDPEFTAALADIDGDAMEANPDADKQPLNPEIMQGHFAVERVLQSEGKIIGVIQVEAEETLGHYAEWLQVPVQVIRRLNGFSYGRPLHLSQQIKIPLDRVTKEEFEEKRFEFHQELAEDFFATYRVEKVLTYSIKRGDNIWTLSRQEFEVPLWLLKRYNADVDFGALIPSQKLLIPIVEKNV
ncbi:MAG: transglycosylase SLT domain-containing protein [Desulfobacterales bacterium]|nr:MAG: transglycosylase SLT domain-containing protein [Desulfobacterales bacterium]